MPPLRNWTTLQPGLTPAPSYPGPDHATLITANTHWDLSWHETAASMCMDMDQTLDYVILRDNKKHLTVLHLFFHWVIYRSHEWSMLYHIIHKHIHYETANVDLIHNWSKLMIHQLLTSIFVRPFSISLCTLAICSCNAQSVRCMMNMHMFLKSIMSNEEFLYDYICLSILWLVVHLLLPWKYFVIATMTVLCCENNH